MKMLQTKEKQIRKIQKREREKESKLCMAPFVSGFCKYGKKFQTSCHREKSNKCIRTTFFKRQNTYSSRQLKGEQQSIRCQLFYAHTTHTHTQTHTITETYTHTLAQTHKRHIHTQKTDIIDTN